VKSVEQNWIILKATIVNVFAIQWYRRKKMSMSHGEVAQAFADGKTKGSGSRMFISDDTVFSHGRHYSIARRYFKDGIDYLFNTPYGSVSTEHHRSHVRRAISGSTILIVVGCDINNAGRQYKANGKEIENVKGKLERARTRKDWHIERIEELEAQNEILAQVAIRQRLLESIGDDGNER